MVSQSASWDGQLAVLKLLRVFQQVQISGQAQNSSTALQPSLAWCVVSQALHHRLQPACRHYSTPRCVVRHFRHTRLQTHAACIPSTVNLPGYSYNVDATTGDPSATPCPADT